MSRYIDWTMESQCALRTKKTAAIEKPRHNGPQAPRKRIISSKKLLASAWISITDVLYQEQAELLYNE